MAEFRMPTLGADMTEGTLVEWLVKPGDAVHRGDIVAVVDTDKAAIEIECFQDGVVDRILVKPKTKVPVGTPLAVIAGAVPDSDQPPSQHTRKRGQKARTSPPRPPAVESPLVRHRAHVEGVDLSAVRGSGPDGEITRDDVEAVIAAQPAHLAAPTRDGTPSSRVAASPRGRRRAAELGVDLGTVQGTGPGGAITSDDVERAVTGTPGPPDLPTSAAAMPSRPADHVAVSGPDRAAAMRRAIGELMARSKREIPHYYVSSTVDLSRALEWLHDTNATRSVNARIVPAALLLKAAAIAAREVPATNGRWVDGRHERAPHVHLGVAVAIRPSGLVAPAILDADTLDLETMMARLLDLTKRARSGRLRRREMNDGTLTMTSLGDNGAESVQGVIFPPQVALIGVGRILERPWAHDGLLGVRSSVIATLAGDHRASDGLDGSRYLATFDNALQAPEKL